MAFSETSTLIMNQNRNEKKDNSYLSSLSEHGNLKGLLALQVSQGRAEGRSGGLSNPEIKIFDKFSSQFGLIKDKKASILLKITCTNT